MEYKEFEKRVLDIRSLSNKPLETKIKKLFNDISIPMQLPVMPNEVIAGESLLTTFKINDKPFECTPIEALKILVAAIPHNKYDGSDTKEHWHKIEGWLNELIKKASQREA